MNLRYYQWQGAQWLATQGKGILGFQVGLGKTYTALQACAELDASKTLVIVPKVLKKQWELEIRKFYGPTPVNIVYGPAPLPVNDKPTYVLAHYEQFQNSRELRKGKEAKDVTKWYLSFKWGVVIVDEVHYIKNRNSQRTKWIKKIRANYKFGLTGTPVAEHPQDLWSLLNWLAPKEFRSFWHFVGTYCELEENPWARHSKRILGLKYLPNPNGHWTTEVILGLLRRATEPYVLVKRLEDVGVDLPDVVENFVTLEMEGAQLELYRQVEKQSKIDLVEEHGKPDIWDLSGQDQLIIKSAAARYIRLQQVTSAGTVFMPNLNNVKMEWLREYVEGGGEPGVIMTRFKHTAGMITRFLQDQGAADEWIVGTYEKLGTGLNLQHKRILVAWDPPKSRLDWEQAVGRIHRLGQERNQIVFKLRVGDGVDSVAWDHIEHKQDTVNQILVWLRGLAGEINEETT